jgi:hypothetical protein
MLVAEKGENFMIQEKMRKPLAPVEKKLPLPVFPAAQTKYVELIANQLLNQPLTPIGPGYPELFDETIDVAGWKEIRVWVHVFVDNYQTTPIATTSARLELRFMHNFAGGSFDYDKAVFQTNVTSYIDGFAVKPVIGNKLRLLCHPENLPPGPYRLSVTYLLV